MSMESPDRTRVRSTGRHAPSTTWKWYSNSISTPTHRLSTNCRAENANYEAWINEDDRSDFIWDFKMGLRGLQGSSRLRGMDHSGRPFQMIIDHGETVNYQKSSWKNFEKPSTNHRARWATMSRVDDDEETYGVAYSIPSCRRQLNQVGFSYQKPRPSIVTAAPADGEKFEKVRKEAFGSWTPQ